MPQAPVLPLVTRPSSPTNPAQDAPDHVPSMALTGSQRTPKKQQGAKKSKRKTMGTDHKSSPRNKKSRSSGGTTTSSETASTSFARPTKPTTMKQSEVPIFSRLPSRPEPTTLVKPNPLTLPTGGPAPGISALPPAAAPYVVVVEKHYHHHAGLAPPLYASSVPQGLEPQGTTPPATDVHYRLVPVPSTTTTTTVPQALSSSLYDPQFEMRALSHLAANGSLLPSGFPAHASSLYAAPALAAATEGLTPTAAPHTTLTQTMVHPPSSQVPPPQPPSWNTHHKTSDASSWSAEPHRNRTRDARVGLPLTRGSLVQPPPPHATDSGLQPLPPRLPVPRTRTTSASSSSGPEIITIDDDDSDHEEEPRVPSPQGSSVHGTTTVKPNPQEKEPSAAAAAIASSLSKNAKRNTKKNKDSSTVEVTSKRLEEILQKHDETTKTDKSKHMVVERKRSNSPISDITNNDILTGVRRYVYQWNWRKDSYVCESNELNELSGSRGCDFVFVAEEEPLIIRAIDCFRTWLANFMTFTLRLDPILKRQPWPIFSWKPSTSVVVGSCDDKIASTICPKVFPMSSCHRTKHDNEPAMSSFDTARASGETSHPTALPKTNVPEQGHERLDLSDCL